MKALEITNIIRDSLHPQFLIPTTKMYSELSLIRDTPKNVHSWKIIG